VGYGTREAGCTEAAKKGEKTAAQFRERLGELVTMHVKLSETATENAIAVSRQLDRSVNSVVNLIVQRINPEDLEGVISVKGECEKKAELKAEKILKKKLQVIRPRRVWMDEYKIGW
jgi:hypothetical protein